MFAPARLSVGWQLAPPPCPPLPPPLTAACISTVAIGLGGVVGLLVAGAIFSDIMDNCEVLCGLRMYQ